MQGTRERPLAAFSSLHTALASLQIKKAFFCHSQQQKLEN